MAGGARKFWRQLAAFRPANFGGMEERAWHVKRLPLWDSLQLDIPRVGFRASHGMVAWVGLPTRF